MAETEELRLIVTLDDQTGAGLAQLRQNVQSVAGGEQHQQLEQLKKSHSELVEVLKKMTAASGELGEAQGLLARNFGAVGIGVAGFVGALGIAIGLTREFANEMLKLNATARAFGLDAGMLKGITEQMQQMGVAPGRATAMVTELTSALADLSREGSRLRVQLMQGARSDPEAMQAWIGRMTGFNNRGDMVNAWNEFITGVNNAYEAELKRTGSKPMAADLRNQILRMFGVSPEDFAQAAGKLKLITPEELHEINKGVELSKQFNVEWVKASQEVEKLIRAFAIDFLPVLTSAVSAIRHMYEYWKMINDIRNPSPDNVNNLLEKMGVPKWLRDWNLYGTGAAPHGTPETPPTPAPGTSGVPLGMPRGVPRSPYESGGPLHGPATPYHFGGEAGWRGLPMSRNIEDRRGEADLLTQNTAQLIRLNENLERMLGVPAGAGGGGYGFLSTGGPVASRMREILGGGGGGGGGGPGGGGGGGGGGGVPYGSDVGPGSGPGAGATPPGGGAAGAGTGPRPHSPYETGGPLAGGGGESPWDKFQREQSGAAGAGGAPAGTGAAGAPGGRISGGGEVNDAIRATAGMAGMDEAHWKAIASIESGLNPRSNIDRATQYKGLFQVGSRGPHSEWARKGEGGDIYNAMDNASAAARLAQENNAAFKKHFGRDPTPAETYLMHQQGLGFYTRGKMTNIAGNPYPGMRGPQTHESFEAGWTREVERRAARFAGGEGGGGGHPTATAGPAGDPSVPQHILDQARAVALHSGPGGVDRFMREQGYPKAGAWCGEFAASVVKSVGLTPPKNPAVASNWRNFGAPVEGAPQPGDVAVRRGVRTGSTGSHVTFVQSYDPETGRFKSLGGNQGRGGFEASYPASRFDFRRAVGGGPASPTASPGSTGLRDAGLDLFNRSALSKSDVTKVEGTGKLTVDVKAPPGTSVGAEGGGLFKTTEISRSNQMEPAKTGPSTEEVANSGLAGIN
jgi:uncharacterized protein (TIGR02594 family)